MSFSHKSRYQVFFYLVDEFIAFQRKFLFILFVCRLLNTINKTIYLFIRHTPSNEYYVPGLNNYKEFL